MIITFQFSDFFNLVSSNKAYDIYNNREISILEIEVFLTNVMTRIRDNKPFPLPDESPLFVVFYELVLHNYLMGKALKARFGGGGGNPFLEAKLKKEITEHEYEIAMSNVEAIASFFEVIQTGWNYLEAELKIHSPNRYPASETCYYFAVLEEHCKATFNKHKTGFTNSANRQEKYLRITRNLEALDHFDDTNQAKIRQYRSERDKYLSEACPTPKPLYHFAMQVFRQKALGGDRVMQRKLREFQRKTALQASLLAQQIEKERKSGIYKSSKWVNGVCYEGKKGGWKKSKNIKIPIGEDFWITLEN